MASVIISVVTVTATATQPAITTTATVTAKALVDTVYYEAWTSGMSTIGMFNFFLGLLVMGIVGFNLFILVILVQSVGGAVAYGLAWIAYYGEYSWRTKMIASIIADIFWLLQEGSLSFYSFLIVRRIVTGRERIVYLLVFWFFATCIAGCRVPIIVSRAFMAEHHDNDPPLQTRINRYHTGYFISIALCECWNAYFLLKKFFKARERRKSIMNSDKSRTSVVSRSSSLKGPLAFRGGLYTQLIRSSEIRVASLALIGIFRSITYIWQVDAQSATNVITQMDRFVCCLETLFANLFIVDVLASRLAFQDQRGARAGSDSAATEQSGTGKEWVVRRHNTFDVTVADDKNYPLEEEYDPKRAADVEAISTELKPTARETISSRGRHSVERRAGNSSSNSTQIGVRIEAMEQL